MKQFSLYFKQKHSNVRQQRKMIKEALSGGANTVTVISQKTGLATELVVWNLLGMLKWGDIEVAGEENHELVYSMKEA